MSADNGIYILILKDEYRVIHAQGIDNLEFWHQKDKQGYNPCQIVDYFGFSARFDDHASARKHAEQLHSDFGWTEYGISSISLREYRWEDIEKWASTEALAEMDAILYGPEPWKWSDDVEFLKTLVL